MNSEDAKTQNIGGQTVDGLHTLPLDVTRCLGGGCADVGRCLRYLARHEDVPGRSFIHGGVFIAGVCLYLIPAKS